MRSNNYNDKRTRDLLNDSGIEKTSADFTRRVMDRVEKERRLYPYKRDNTLLHILIAIVLPVLYFLIQAFWGGGSIFTDLNLTVDIQPYIQLFHLLTDKLVMDISSPIVPLGLLAIVLLLAFDRLILRSLSFK